MWALKFKVREEWNVYNKRTEKFNVNVYFYSQNYYIEKIYYYYVGTGIVVGNNKDNFFRDLKKDSKVKNLTYSNNFFVCTYKEKKSSKRAKYVYIAYNPRFVFLKPVIIDNKGWEEWEIASHKREDLEELLKIMELFEHKVFYFKKINLKNMTIFSILPNLTEKQQMALTLAVKNDYYNYPKGSSIKELAKLMKISSSTFQFHLAKAESKIMPFLLKHNISNISDKK